MSVSAVAAAHTADGYSRLHNGRRVPCGVEERLAQAVERDLAAEGEIIGGVLLAILDKLEPHFTGDVVHQRKLRDWAAQLAVVELHRANGEEVEDPPMPVLVTRDEADMSASVDDEPTVAHTVR